MKVSEKTFDDAKARALQHTMEAINEVFHRMPFGQEVTLGTNGVRAIIRPVGTPDDGSDREDQYRDIPNFTFDVRAIDGSWHIEFTVRQTGWGGVP